MPHPHPVVLRRYRELGGEIVTVGSMPLSSDRIAYDFDRARDLLLDCGFKYYAYYKALEPVFHALGPSSASPRQPLLVSTVAYNQ